ncbi:MAG TPA: 3D-(3,5/4)-trihydroxycyclohexane-1,2-dione acylhydrolase (decyclizing), partial [Alphaproteobacteria bacterium]|nr:3D-(3,5/4)-trihydroxycyclohexane-1,2-dione acylhydrolase (decyclizing) [Alphaproteobacteria bacterium]
VEAHPMYVGSLGVTGASAANNLAAKADVVLSVGSRLQDFTTGSNSLISGQVVALNVQPHDLVKHGAMPLMADALNGIEALAAGMAGYRTDDAYQSEIAGEWQGWT